MRGFRSTNYAREFLAAFSVNGTFFRASRHLLQTSNFRELMQRPFSDWHEVVNIPGGALRDQITCDHREESRLDFYLAPLS